MIIPEKKRWQKFFIAAVLLFPIIAAQYSIAFTGKFCGADSPCACGSNCSSGGNELFGNSQAYCDSNPIECFNTIDSCADGTLVTLNYVKNINLTSLNDSIFKVGDVIEVDATLHSSSANPEGVFFVYSNSTQNSSVNWSVFHSTSFGLADSNYHIKVNYTIQNRPGNQTIRVIDEYNTYKNITCGRDSNADFPLYSDTDDITFTVAPEPTPKINFTGPTPSNETSFTTVSITINVTHNESYPEKLILSWNGTNESYSYSGAFTAITKTNLRQGNYSFYVWLNDSYGNFNQTETRTITISTPIDITFGIPAANQTFRNSSVMLNLTVKPTQDTKTIKWVAYALNENNNVSVISFLNITADASDAPAINETLISYPNLSQSFVPHQLMEVENISIRLKMTGMPNATLQLMTDNGNSPSGTVLANFSINNATVSNSGFDWVNISFNSTATLQANTKYWLYLSPNGSNEDHYDWEATAQNQSPEGSFLQNQSRDLLFRIFDRYRMRAILTAVEGYNNLTVYANNSDSTTVSSSLVSFISDTIPPTFAGVNESSDPIEAGDDLTISINVTDPSSGINTILLQFNGTNRTLSGNNPYSTTFAPFAVGTNNYTFYINDSAGNVNSSQTFNFTVIDTRVPTFSSLANFPNESNELDPFALINVTVTILDAGGVSSAILQYKNSSDSEWANTTMSNSSSLYYANFTPNASEIWSYRVWANDTSGNSNYSANSSLNISYDYNWTRIPNAFSTISGIRGKNVTLGNLTINNTGDFVLSFDITASQSFVLLNRTTPFNIEAHNFTVIQVNATTPITEAVYTILITTDAQNATASPDSLMTNSSLVSIASGPYLLVEILQYNASVSVDDYFTLIAKVTNIGNQTAVNATSNWTFPSGWTTFPETVNKTLGNLGVNRFEYHNISILITSSAVAGAQTITVFGFSDTGTNNSASETVTVAANTTVTPVTTTSSGGGGGSSGGGGGGGGGLLPYVKPKYDASVTAPKKIELLTEQNGSFEINITNNVQNTTLEDLRFSVDGFLLSKLSLEPDYIEKLDFGETKTIRLSIDVPKYLKGQNLTLVFTIKGTARDARDAINKTRSNADFEKKTEINLVIIEVTKEAALESLSKAESDIANLKGAGFNAAQLEELYAQAQNAFEESNYGKVKQLGDKIFSLKEKALSVAASIKELEEKIRVAAGQGSDVSEAMQLLELAKGLLQRGNFEEAESMVGKALLAERIGSKTSEAKFSRLLSDFAKKYWFYLIAGITFGIMVFIFFRKRMSMKLISEKLDSLKKEEENIMDLTKTKQDEYFIQGLMSERLYKKIIDQHSKRMAEIQKTKIKLTSRKISLLKRASDAAALEKEKIELKKLMEDLQRKYFVSKIISNEAYESASSDFRERVAELDKLISLKKK